MKRNEYSEELRAAAKALQEKYPVDCESNTGNGRIINAVLATGSYAKAAQLVGQSIGEVSPGLVRGEFQKLAKKHGVALPKMPHSVYPKPDGIAKIVAALGRMAAGLRDALGHKPKRRRKSVKKGRR
jgi:hypothetical protein